MIIDDNVSTLQYIRLTPKWTKSLILFFQALEESGDIYNFNPHPATENIINELATHSGLDLYYLLIERDKILGYGLLRGWDEGFEVPSLGIAIHPSTGGRGLGESLMLFLHSEARKRGSKKIRLRVRVKNRVAIKLYRKMGYILKNEGSKDEYLIGFKQLTKE